MRQEVDPDFASYVAARQHQFLRAAFLVCGDRTLAEDLLQEAFVKLALRWDKIRSENPDGFVRTILYRDAVSTWRHRRREVLVDLVPEGRGGRDETADSSALRVDLLSALDVLTPKQRAVVVLRYFDDRSVAEAADALGVSEGTVKSQTYAALERLRTVVPGYVSGQVGQEEER
jgi:RNA polymerase sigma-70 factor (sigma-E family)